jgi:hypothetical protein
MSPTVSPGSPRSEVVGGHGGYGGHLGTRRGTRAPCRSTVCLKALSKADPAVLREIADDFLSEAVER